MAEEAGKPHYRFNSQMEIGSPFRADFTESAIKNEPMLFGCDVPTAYSLGGPLTHAFLNELLLAWPEEHLIIDSRVHMLMPGWLPCIPGFHHDDVARTRSDGQPNYDEMPYRSRHCMALINGDIAPTCFAIGECDMPPIDGPAPIYRRWHSEVENLIFKGDLKPRLAPSGRLVFFDWQSFHQGTRAVASGWRWFIRASRDTARVNRPANELRRQVQVYLDNAMEGW